MEDISANLESANVDEDSMLRDLPPQTGSDGDPVDAVSSSENFTSVSSTRSPQDSNTAPVTRSTSGVFRGSWMRSRRGRLIEAYRGIRYAKPPVGEFRFQPPILIEHYSEEVDATQEGPACPQPISDYSKIDEDCLRLNVYTHTQKGELRPVIVYLHSGGFYSVSGRSDVAGPDYLLDRDIILVTLNYRLASLGFLSTGDQYAPGNNGLKDQVMALRWVKRNIAAFGGDPNVVTIAGYSAGSFSVALHMVSPMSKGLFHRAISMSGSPISQIVIPTNQRHLAVKQAELLNVPTHSSEAIIEGLKSKPSKELGDSLLNFYEFAYDPMLIWTPVIEQDFGQERFLTMQPLESVQQGKMHAVPYIISQTQDEFFWKAFTILKNDTFLNTMNNEWDRIAPISFFLPPINARVTAGKLKEFYLGGKQLSKDKASAEALGKLYSDALVGFGLHRLANLMCEYSPQPVYYYEFSYIGNHSHYEDPVTKKPVGAAHHDDLIYLFGITFSFPLIQVSDSLDSQIVDKITGIWYNFAKYGNPNPRDDIPELAGMSWPVMKPNSRKYLRIGKDLTVHENLFEDRFRVWEELFPLPK